MTLWSIFVEHLRREARILGSGVVDHVLMLDPSELSCMDLLEGPVNRIMRSVQGHEEIQASSICRVDHVVNNGNRNGRAGFQREYSTRSIRGAKRIRET